MTNRGMTIAHFAVHRGDEEISAFYREKGVFTPIQLILTIELPFILLTSIRIFYGSLDCHRNNPLRQDSIRQDIHWDDVTLKASLPHYLCHHGKCRKCRNSL